MTTRQPPLIVGIDLGTTNSLVAVLQAGAPTLIPNAIGEHLTPSAVSVRDAGDILVGAAALARATTHPESTAVAFKRDMGTDRAYQLAGRAFTAPTLSALVLRSLREDAEAFLGRPVDEAVITVPAYFDESQRRATRDAAAIAGLHVERIINEPTAAALAYGLHNRDREFRAAVLDLGGGTFDVTILEVMEGVIEIRASSGDTRLGGEDFVEALVRLIADRRRMAATALAPVMRARLQSACEHAKRMLSSMEEARVVVPGFVLPEGTRIDLDEGVTRAEAEEIWGLLGSRIRRPVSQALRDAALRPDQIDEVLLVGGATRMPMVARLAAEIFGRLPLRTLPPDEAVAMGAAVQAALKARDTAVEDLVATDVAPFSLGISSGSRLGGALVTGLFVPVIERGTVIPASRVQSFAPLERGQRALKVEVFQGEHALCKDNRKLGEFTVGGLPSGPAEEATVSVRFTYDQNGLLEVEATVDATGAKKAIVIEGTPGVLSPAEIDAARRAMERLKFHPRESLPNATALGRADALFAELVGREREALGEALTHFRLALERQDPKEIHEGRETLLALIAAFGARG